MQITKPNMTPQDTVDATDRAPRRRMQPGRNGRPQKEGPHPFQIPLFRMLWIATLVSNVGTWMQEVANSWLMTSLAPDPLMVSLVQVATALPMFMLGLPAGALADLVDKRRWLLGTQIWMMLAAAMMAAIALSGSMTSWTLLLGSFLLSVGAAMNSPGWHSVTPEIVPKETLQQAVTLNGVVINCARALGPALGGLVVVQAGPAAAFTLNAVSFMAVVFVLFCWKRDRRTADLPSENLFSAMRVGLQHVRHSPAMRLLILRASILVFVTSATWALLPLLCRQEFGFGAMGYSSMLVANAMGAIFGATYALPRLRDRWDTNQIVSYAWIGFIPTLLVLSFTGGVIIPFLAMFWGGVCNILMLSCFHLAAQSLAPEWVRARALAVYLLTFSGATTLGALFWGYIARGIGLRQCLTVSALFLLAGCVTSWLVPLRSGEDFDDKKVDYWSAHALNLKVPLNHGPIAVMMDFDIAPEDAQDFLAAMERIRRIRYRNGVLRWSIYVDLENPNIYHEVYVEESWAAHLRTHERVSAYELAVTEQAFKYHRGSEPPKARHLAYCDKDFPTASDTNPKPKEVMKQPEIPLWFLD